MLYSFLKSLLANPTFVGAYFSFSWIKRQHWTHILGTWCLDSDSSHALEAILPSAFISSGQDGGHLPNYSWHHFRSEEHTEHGESLREEQTHDREHQHQASLQVWHTQRTNNKTKAERPTAVSTYGIYTADLLMSCDISGSSNGLQAWGESILSPDLKKDPLLYLSLQMTCPSFEFLFNHAWLF